MEIYLIRHTTPDVVKGTCYGQADLDITESFEEEAAAIIQHLPADIEVVYSSPLQRCHKLAKHLFSSHAIELDARLKEINCGEWEMQLWDDIEKEPLQKWMADFVHVSTPQGESYLDLYNRVVSFFSALPNDKRLAIVAHGGVLRSVLSHITQTPLLDSFNQFSLRYGCVIQLKQAGDGFLHTVLHNPLTEKEQHKPSYR